MPARSNGTPVPTEELGEPARRALAGAGYTTLEPFARSQEAAIEELHGVGSKAFDANGLSFTGTD